MKCEKVIIHYSTEPLPVFDKPVILPIFSGSITYNQNSVVQLCTAALWLSVYTYIQNKINISITQTSNVYTYMYIPI